MSLLLCITCKILKENKFVCYFIQVVDREILHSQAETERNTLIKDTMRERSVVDMANSWYDILVSKTCIYFYLKLISLLIYS